MLAKGAETLPNKMAHDYKALAVPLPISRNSTTPKTTRKGSRMPRRFYSHTLIILRHSQWKPFLSWASEMRTRPKSMPKWRSWRAEWWACSAGIHMAPSWSTRRISSKLPSVSSRPPTSRRTTCRSSEKQPRCKFKCATTLTTSQQGGKFCSSNPTWSTTGQHLQLPTTWKEISNNFTKLWAQSTTSAFQSKWSPSRLRITWFTGQSRSKTDCSSRECMTICIKIRH